MRGLILTRDVSITNVELKSWQRFRKRIFRREALACRRGQHVVTAAVPDKVFDKTHRCLRGAKDRQPRGDRHHHQVALEPNELVVVANGGLARRRYTVAGYL